MEFIVRVPVKWLMDHADALSHYMCWITNVKVYTAVQESRVTSTVSAAR